VITGATGFIGTHLVDRLTDIGFDRILAPIRSYRTCAPVARFPITIRRADLLDPQTVKASVEGARYVFHLAYGRDGKNGAQMTIEGTRQVVEAAIAARVESVVVLSTAWVFGRSNQPDVRDENCPYDPVPGEYAESKAEMEQWCLARARSSSATRIVLLNPTCVYGPRGGAYTTLPVRMAENGSLCWIDDGRGIANYTYVDNVVDAMLLAATVPEAHGQRFIISDGTTTWRTFLTPLLGSLAQNLPSYSHAELVRLNRGLRTGWIDIARTVIRNPDTRAGLMTRPIVQQLLSIAESRAPSVVEGVRASAKSTPSTAHDSEAKAAVPPAWLDELFGPYYTTWSAARAEQVLGWKPLIGLDDGQQRTVEWLNDSGLAESAEVEQVSLAIELR
jgi:nucleoside-diphosphate-sugar epimerase